MRGMVELIREPRRVSGLRCCQCVHLESTAVASQSQHLGVRLVTIGPAFLPLRRPTLSPPPRCFPGDPDPSLR